MTHPAFDLELREEFVRPFYLNLLHGNFASGIGGGDGFNRQLGHASAAISDEQLVQLFREREWRGRLCAAWFVGLSNRPQFVALIGELLLASQMVYAGQGYCVALGLVGGQKCAEILHAYLKQYLPLSGRVYNQDWALGALANVEGMVPENYLAPALWQDDQYVMDSYAGLSRFRALVSYLVQCELIVVPPQTG